jgi:hypothetical protein
LPSTAQIIRKKIVNDRLEKSFIYIKNIGTLILVGYVTKLQFRPTCVEEKKGKFSSKVVKTNQENISAWL